jgi:hypothetical protein
MSVYGRVFPEEDPASIYRSCRVCKLELAWRIYPATRRYGGAAFGFLRCKFRVSIVSQLPGRLILCGLTSVLVHEGGEFGGTAV